MTKKIIYVEDNKNYDLSRFKENPVVLENHNMEKAIGKCTYAGIQETTDGSQLMLEIELNEEYKDDVTLKNGMIGLGWIQKKVGEGDIQRELLEVSFVKKHEKLN